MERDLMDEPDPLIEAAEELYELADIWWGTKQMFGKPRELWKFDKNGQWMEVIEYWMETEEGKVVPAVIHHFDTEDGEISGYSTVNYLKVLAYSLKNPK
ncbi:MAG: hypothetical protein AAF530_25370 [Pseudomonadota bacterium]